MTSDWPVDLDFERHKQTNEYTLIDSTVLYMDDKQHRAMLNRPETCPSIDISLLGHFSALYNLPCFSRKFNPVPTSTAFHHYSASSSETKIGGYIKRIAT